ncbi:hypothetical protein ONA70_35260, partial [Micromonospora yasonensis]|uniref:hypothetical protein n=1 Tax=Micromonospora yasonensis TaxID=1128667 RepID=UPI0022304AD1
RLVQAPGVGQELGKADARVPGIGARIGPQVGDRLLGPAALDEHLDPIHAEVERVQSALRGDVVDDRGLCRAGPARSAACTAGG